VRAAFGQAEQGAGRAGSMVQALRLRFKSLGGAVGKIGGMLSAVPGVAMLGGAIGALGSVGGLFALAEHASTAFAELNKSAISAGVSVQQFQELSLAATMADVPVEAMSTGLFRLNRAIADSASGKNKDAAALFSHLGIATRDANGHMRSAAELMPALADAFRNTADPAMRARMAMALFGRGGREMIPLLMRGSESLREFGAEADRLRYPFTGEDTENLEHYHQGMGKLHAAFGGLSDAIGAGLAPVLAPIITDMTNWIAANRDWISQDIAGAVHGIANAFEILSKIVSGLVSGLEKAAGLMTVFSHSRMADVVSDNVQAMPSGLVGDYNPMAPGALGPSSSPLRPGGPAAGDRQVNVEGHVKTTIEFRNAPPGMTTRSESSGAAAQPDVDVGFSQAGLAGVM